jgi:hypothetical protein
VGSPSLVFPPEWIAEQKSKYERHASHARPSLYRFWTADSDQGLRASIERLIEQLSEEQRQRVIPRLRDPKQFEEAINELRVGESLRLMGHSVEYEPNLGNLTPDWSVLTVGTSSRFIVEVVSSNPPRNRELCDQGWDRLRIRMQALSGDAILSLQPPFPPFYDDGDDLLPKPA